MAYSALPTRTSSDPNSAADVNTLQSNISLFGGAVSSITSSYTITDSDDFGYIVVNSSSGSVTVTLPTLADNQDREITILHETDGNDILVDGEGAETIDGLTSIRLSKEDDRLRIKAVANEWRIVDERISAQLRLDTYAGLGSTDTTIMRFTNSRESYGVNTGGMFSENHSTGYNSNNEGLEITITRAGRYGFSFSGSPPSAGRVGLSVNSSQLTTAISGINIQDRLVIQQGDPANNIDQCACSWQGWLDASDVIRAHAQNLAWNTIAHFTVTYLGS